jgi:4'-phosphopantetheinyl transferase
VSRAARAPAEWATVTPPVELGPQEAHVWRASTALDRPAIARLWTLLDLDEEQRALRLAKGAVRDAFVVTRAVLRHVLAAYVVREPEELSFHYGAHGKPFLDGAAGAWLRFSVTHTQGLALFALARGRELGVDVERERMPRRAGAIAERLFAGRTRTILGSLDGEDRAHAFLAAWTQREAYVKAIGGRVFRSNDPLPFHWPRSDELARSEEHEVGGATRFWSIQPLTPFAGYIASLVVEGAITGVRRFDAAALLQA